MIYGHPAPCLVTRLRRGAVLVEPLRFIPLSEIGQPSGRLEGRAPDLNHGAQPGGAPFPALPGEQMRAASTPRSRSGVILSPDRQQNTGPAALKQPTTCAAAMAMLQKEQGCAGATGGFDAPESIASTN